MKEDSAAKEDRLRAARFYYKSLTGLQQDWVDMGAVNEGVDEDVVSLAREFSAVRSDEMARCIAAGMALRDEKESAAVAFEREACARLVETYSPSRVTEIPLARFTQYLAGMIRSRKPL